MAAAIKVLYILHMVGLLAILAGWLMAVRTQTDLRALVWGARIQVLLGLVLVGLHSAQGASLGHLWIGLKFLIAIGVVACSEIAAVRADQGTFKPVLVHAAAALTVLNVVVAFAVK